MRNKGAPSPETIRTVKLLKYLLSGRSVEVEGRSYYLKTVTRLGDGAMDGDALPVDNWTMEEFKNLAESLEGKTYTDVMNYKAVGPGESQ